MKTTRRDLLRLAGGAAAAALAAPTILRGAAAQPAGKPNVLFIPVDDLRPQLAAYGRKKMKTPNLDRLAADGTLFERAYCQQAVCAPSRASLLSGCRPDTTRVYDLQTPLPTTMPNVVTLPQHFKAHGYTTVSLGKVYHHGAKDDPKGWSEPPWVPPDAFPGYALDESKALMRAANPVQEKVKMKTAAAQRRGPPTECGDLADDAYADGKLAAQAMECLRRLKDGPFFLAAGFFRPHLAFACPKKYWDLYKRDEVDLADNPFRPKGCPDIALHNWGELRAYHGIPAEGPVSEAQARELVHGYYACVSFMDAQVGKVLDELRRLGLAEKTIVVLWGDHGWHLGDHGLWCKHSNFETAVHTPLLARAPGLPAGGRTARLTEFVDICPSLCELAGLPMPEHLEGTSFVPLMKDPGRQWKKAAFSQYPRGRAMGHSMRTERWRLTRWLDPAGAAVAVELYDHQNDPAENVNLADAPAHAATLAELTAQAARGWRGSLPPA
ncbi:MAG: sulfatase [Planctomycetes bacterium]|nr:sulfatase [Planctomycetota bacterium]